MSWFTNCCSASKISMRPPLKNSSKRKESKRGCSKPGAAELLFLIVCLISHTPTLSEAKAVLFENTKQPEVPVRGQLSHYSKRTDYLSLSDLKSQRRMGIGAEVLGRLGMVGVAMDLNFHPWHSATVGLGAGPQYFSYSLGYKTTLSEKSLSPYLGLSATRLEQTVRRPLEETIPAWIGDYFSKDEMFRRSEVPRTFLSPQIGVQYTQFYGPSAGATLYLEILLMYEVNVRKVAPIAGLGMMYYL